jgi:predicted nucleic acid-binding protein
VKWNTGCASVASDVVVDTNVVAYYLLGTVPFADEARAFWRVGDSVSAPAHWQAELANVIWMAVRTGVLAADEGHRRLDFASRLRIRSVSIGSLWQRALATALASDVSVYDSLFVELARRQRSLLVTFDARVLKAFPEIARRPSEASSESRRR